MVIGLGSLEQRSVTLSPPQRTQRIFQEAIVHEGFRVKVGTLFERGDLEFGTHHNAFRRELR